MKISKKTALILSAVAAQIVLLIIAFLITNALQDSKKFGQAEVNAAKYLSEIERFSEQMSAKETITAADFNDIPQLERVDGVKGVPKYEQAVSIDTEYGKFAAYAADLLRNENKGFNEAKDKATMMDESYYFTYDLANEPAKVLDTEKKKTESDRFDGGKYDVYLKSIQASYVKYFDALETKLKENESKIAAVRFDSVARNQLLEFLKAQQAEAIKAAGDCKVSLEKIKPDTTTQLRYTQCKLAAEKEFRDFKDSFIPLFIIPGKAKSLIDDINLATATKAAVVWRNEQFKAGGSPGLTATDVLNIDLAKQVLVSSTRTNVVDGINVSELNASRYEAAAYSLLNMVRTNNSLQPLDQSRYMLLTGPSYARDQAYGSRLLQDLFALSDEHNLSSETSAEYYQKKLAAITTNAYVQPEMTAIRQQFAAALDAKIKAAAVSKQLEANRGSEDDGSEFFALTDELTDYSRAQTAAYDRIIDQTIIIETKLKDRPSFYAVVLQDLNRLTASKQ